MKYLLDTATFIWIMNDQPEKISPQALEVIQEREDVFLSAVSPWEIAIKYSIGKLEVSEKPKTLLPSLVLKMGLKQLPVTHRHALEVASLPKHHNDPFDRLLVSQCRLEGMILISPDLFLKKYKIKMIW